MAEQGQPRRRSRSQTAKAAAADEPADTYGQNDRDAGEGNDGGGGYDAGGGSDGGGYDPGDSDDENEAVEAHAAFVVSHFGGGVEATPELLDRASAVWQQLPGAVVRGAAQLRPHPPAPDTGGESR